MAEPGAAGHQWVCLGLGGTAVRPLHPEILEIGLIQQDATRGVMSHLYDLEPELLVLHREVRELLRQLLGRGRRDRGRPAVDRLRHEGIGHTVGLQAPISIE